jgi:invasion protein IalB
MLNGLFWKQTLVAILVAAPALADPPNARVAVRGFADWRLDCTALPCVAWTAVTGAGGAEVMRLALEGDAPPQLRFSTGLPLYLPDGLVLAVGSEPPLTLAWRICGLDGCEAQAAVTPELAAALRRERSGIATFTPADGVPVRVPFSLMGYTAALRARR